MEEFSAFISAPQETKPAKKDVVALAQVLGRAGVGIEPDPRLGGAVLTSGSMVLFAAPDGPTAAASDAYQAATLLLHLAAAVSASGGDFDESEQRHLSDHLERALHLTADERRRLHAHLRWLTVTPVKLTGLPRRIAAIDPAQRRYVAEYLTAMAAADGHVSPDEMKTLTKIYRLLELDPAHLPAANLRLSQPAHLLDRMVGDDGVAYDYDALGRVETRTSSGAQATFGRDPSGHTLSLSDGAGAQFAFCDLRGDLIGTFINTETALADSIAYNPFGEVTARSGAAHTLGYQGGYTDPDTGKVNMAARWYQPATGSFVSRDTLLQNPDPSVQLNRYTYANDNPLTNTDPTGHASCAKKPSQKKCKAALQTVKDAKTGSKKWNAACSTLGVTKKECQGLDKQYTHCVYPKKTTSACVDMAGDYITCRKENGSTQKQCDQSASYYMSCRNKDIDKKTCSGAERSWRDCLNDYGANDTRECGGTREHFYGCMKKLGSGGDNWDGHDSKCANYAELGYRCDASHLLHPDDCRTSLGGYMSCLNNSGASVYSCSFGSLQRMYRLRDVRTGWFDSADVCTAAWEASKKCAKPCSGGVDWRNQSSAICETKKDGEGALATPDTKCSYYVSSKTWKTTRTMVTSSRP